MSTLADSLPAPDAETVRKILAILATVEPGQVAA